MINQSIHDRQSTITTAPINGWDDRALDIQDKQKKFKGFRRLRFATKFLIGSLLFFITLLQLLFLVALH